MWATAVATRSGQGPATMIFVLGVNTISLQIWSTHRILEGKKLPRVRLFAYCPCH